MVFFIPIIFHLAFVEPARVSTWISQIRESNFLSSSPVSSFSALLVLILNYISIYLILNVKACTPMWRLLKLYWSRCGRFIFSPSNVCIKMPYVSPVGEIIEYILGKKKNRFFKVTIKCLTTRRERVLNLKGSYMKQLFFYDGGGWGNPCGVFIWMTEGKWCFSIMKWRSSVICFIFG